METHTTLMDMHFEHRDAIAEKKPKTSKCPIWTSVDFSVYKKETSI